MWCFIKIFRPRILSFIVFKIAKWTFWHWLRILFRKASYVVICWNYDLCSSFFWPGPWISELYWGWSPLFNKKISSMVQRWKYCVRWMDTLKIGLWINTVERVGIILIVKKSVEFHLRWLGHVRRRSVNPNRIDQNQMENSAVVWDRRKPRKTINEIIKEDLNLNDLSAYMDYIRIQ